MLKRDHHQAAGWPRVWRRPQSPEAQRSPSPTGLRALLLSVGTMASLLLPTPSNATIVEVGSNSADLPQLAPAEQARLATLMDLQRPTLLSTLSPDGTTAVVGVGNRFGEPPQQIGWLDLATGEIEPAPRLDTALDAPDWPLRWLDNQTLRFAQPSHQQSWDIVTFNRQTELVSHHHLAPLGDEPGEVLGFSPDFAWVVVRVFGDTEDTLYAVAVDSLQRHELARLPPDQDLRSPVWSAQGTHMALVTAAWEENRLSRRTPRSPNLANPVMQDALGRLPAATNPFYQHSSVQVFDFRASPVHQSTLLAPELGRDLIAEAALSPTGQTLLLKLYRPGQVAGRPHPTYLFPESAYYRLFNTAGQPQGQIQRSELSGPTESTGRFISEGQILFWATTGLNRPLYQYERTTAELRPLPLPAGSVDPRSWQVSRDGQILVYGFSSLNQPPELFRLSLTAPAAAPVPLTQLNTAVATANRVRPTPVRFTTPNGERYGLLIQPQDQPFPPQQMPLVLWQQGGPGFSMANEFAVEVEMPLNLLPNFGLAVLAVALSGREGFGPEVYRLQADGENFGQVDILEGVAVADQVVALGWSTPQQLGITGCSYGGYYTSQMISQFPTQFAAANPQCALLDALTEWQLGYAPLLSYLAGATPLEQPERYRRLSPLYNAAEVRHPILMFHGSEDFLPVDLARTFHDVVAANGVPITLYEFLDMGHSLSDPQTQTAAAQVQIEFFRRHLGTMSP